MGGVSIAGNLAFVSLASNSPMPAGVAGIILTPDLSTIGRRGVVIGEGFLRGRKDE